MSQENELQKLREELKAFQDQTRRSRKRAALGFVILLLVMIVSMVYGFIQGVEAERQATLALEQRNLAEEARVHANRNAEEAIRQQKIAEENRIAAETFQAQLLACQKRK